MFEHPRHHYTGFQPLTIPCPVRRRVDSRLTIRYWLVWTVLTFVVTACTPSAAMPGDSANPAAASPTPPGVFFPQQAALEEERDSMAADLVGQLVLVDRCLHVTQRDTGTSFLPIWPPRVTLHQTGTTIEIHDAAGQVVARVGETVFLGGGVVPADALQEVIQPVSQPVPPDCPGPYWVVGEDAVSLEPPTPSS